MTITATLEATARPLNWLCCGCDCSSAREFCAAFCQCRPHMMGCYCECPCPDGGKPPFGALVLDENPGRRRMEQVADDLDWEADRQRYG